MGYVRIDNGNNLLLRVTLSDGNSSMYPQAKVYSSTGTLLTTVSLTNVSGGLYTNTSYTPASGAEYFAVYTVYQDAGHTIAANYDITSDVFDVRQTELSSAVWTNTRAANLDNLDTTVSSRAPASTALSTTQWTNTRAANLDNLDTTVSSRASQTSVNAIPTNPLLTTDARLNSLSNLDATVSSRLASSDSRLSNLDATISSRASQTSVTQIQNNTLAAFVVPEILVIPDSGSTPYNFYAYFYNEVGSPIDPDSQIVHVTIKDSGGTILEGPTAMTRTGLGIYSYQTSISSIDTARTEYVFFDYSVDSVALEQVRSTNVSPYQSDIDILLGRLTDQRAANLDNLDATVSSRALQTTALSIDAQTSQLSFTGSSVNSNVITNTDKTGYALTAGEHTQITLDVWGATLASYQTAGSTGKALNDAAYSGSTLSDLDLQHITYAVWDEPISAHTNPNTFGSRNQVLFTQTEVNNLTNLDVAISTRAPASTAISSGTLTVGRITNLDNLDVPVSSRASNAALAPIAAQTALIPASPATQGAVLAIPTNPLLANDGRLNNLDAAISTRAKPSDLAPLATAADLDSFETSITNDVNAVGASVLTRAQPSDITSAVAPLATSASVAAVQSTVNTIASELLTAADVWTFGTRSLNVPVDTTDDLTPLATTAQLNTTQNNIISAVDYWQSKLTVAINPTTDQMDIVAWLELNGQALTTATQASVNIYDPSNTLVLAVGPDMMTNFQGTFHFTRANASTVLLANTTYTCEVLVVNNAISYRGITPITVF